MENRSGGTTKLDGCIKSLKPSLSETATVREGRVFNGVWTKDMLSEWLGAFKSPF